MSYGERKVGLIWLSVAVTHHVIEKSLSLSLSLQIYDISYYRSEALSSQHLSNQPPETGSNAHHFLMNTINLTVDSLWTLFKVCARSRVVLQMISSGWDVSTCRPRDSGYKSYRRTNTHRHTPVTRQSGREDGEEKHGSTFTSNHLDSSVSLPSFAFLLCLCEHYAKSVVLNKKSVAPRLLHFLISTDRGPGLCGAQSHVC